MAITLERIQHARGTASQWTTANPVLLAGEIGWESDTSQLKVGDGSTNWNSLSYFEPTLAFSNYPQVRSKTTSSGTPAADLPFINADDYGLHHDGTTDNTTILNSLSTAMNTFGGGVVKIMGNNAAFAGQVIIKSGVWFEGDYSNDGTSVYSLVATASSSQIMVGDFTSSPVQGYGSGIRQLSINGNGFGPSTSATANTGLVTVQSVHFSVHEVFVKAAAGCGVAFDACQNGNVWGLVSEGNGGNGISLTNGAGGCSFTGCHSTGNSGSQIIFTDDTGANAYTWGPQQNSFFNCIFESGINCKNIGEFDCGFFNNFYNCLFSANSTVTLSDGCVVRNTAMFSGSSIGMAVDFHDCQFVGGSSLYDCIRAGLDCQVNTWGQTSMSFSNNLLVADGSAPILGVNGTITFGANSTNTSLVHTVNVANSGALTNFRAKTYNYFDFRPDSLWPYVMGGGRRTDAGQRWLLTQDGVWSWGNGSGSAATPNLSGDTTNQAVLMSGSRVSGRIIKDLLVQTTVGAANTAVTINAAAAPVQQIFMNAAGSINSMTITNPISNQYLTIRMSQTGGRSYVWPSNCRFANSNTAPNDTTANCFTSVTLWYDSSVSLWLEDSRSTAVPYV